ncbi:MAG: hypothetical protein ACUVSX_15420 [Aggregatilineales bacterium]
MVVLDSSNAHFSYMDVVSHWCPRSQRFTGGDALLTYLDEGWEIKPEAFYEEFGQTGGRRVTVYYFELRRGEETARMPVISNPFVEHLIHALDLKMCPVGRVNRDRRAARPPLARQA